MMSLIYKLLMADEPTPDLFEEIRCHMDLGITEFCEKVGIDRGNYHRLRSGERPISQRQSLLFQELIDKVAGFDGQSLFRQILEEPPAVFTLTKVKLVIDPPPAVYPSVVMEMIEVKVEEENKKGPKWRYAMIEMIVGDEGSRYAVSIRKAHSRIQLRKPLERPSKKKKRDFDPIPAPAHRDDLEHRLSAGVSVQVSERNIPSF